MNKQSLPIFYSWPDSAPVEPIGRAEMIHDACQPVYFLDFRLQELNITDFFPVYFLITAEGGKK
jgi:hypothetical protein